MTNDFDQKYLKVFSVGVKSIFVVHECEERYTREKLFQCEGTSLSISLLIIASH